MLQSNTSFCRAFASVVTDEKGKKGLCQASLLMETDVQLHRALEWFSTTEYIPQVDGLNIHIKAPRVVIEDALSFAENFLDPIPHRAHSTVFIPLRTSAN